MTRTLTSYDGGVISTPQALVAPRTVEELQAILRDRERFPSPVRPMGSFHSLTPCAASDGTVVDMTRFSAIVAIDTDAMTVTAQAGMQQVDAAAALRASNLQLMLNIEIGNATLGSLATCHSKDSLDGVEHGQVSSYVTRIKWVGPGGELLEADEAESPELLSLVRSSYGLAGIAYEVTLRVKPLEIVDFDFRCVDVDDLTTAIIDEAIATNESVVFWTLGRMVAIQTRNRGTRLRNHWIAGMRQRFWARIGATLARVFRVAYRTPLEGFVGGVWIWLQKLTYRFLDVVGGFSMFDPEKTIDYRRTPPSGRYGFTFWAFPRDAWVVNLRDFLVFTDAHYRATGFRLNLPLGSYFIRHDTSSVLSYSYAGDIISIDPIHAPTRRDRAAWEEFLLAFNAWAAARGGIPLLNQSPFVEREHVVAAYGEQWAKHARWVAEVDPDRRMVNPFFAELLG
jgi:FAD/FMN-containing dehydrogenase